jgi:hypothetical protein
MMETYLPTPLSQDSSYGFFGWFSDPLNVRFEPKTTVIRPESSAIAMRHIRPVAKAVLGEQARQRYYKSSNESSSFPTLSENTSLLYITIV